MAENTSFEGWTDITGTVHLPRGTPAVSFAWRPDKRGQCAAEITLNKALISSVGWEGGKTFQIRLSPDNRKMVFIPAGAGARLIRRVASGTIAHKMPWVQSERRKAEFVAHTMIKGALIIDLPEWARPPQGQLEPEVAQSVAAAQLAGPDQAATAKSAPLVKADETINPPEKDKADAARMVRSGKGALALATEFGWDLGMANAFARAEREKMRQEAA